MGFIDGNTRQSSGSREAPAELLFKGTVSRVTFKNEDASFSVLRVEGDAGEGLVTVIGPLPGGLGIGANIVAHGHWETHPKFGRQFRARFVTEAKPSTPEAMEKYLASGSIKGLGPVLAKRIVQHFGEKTLEIFDTTPDALNDVPGIGEKKLGEIKAAWDEKRNARQVVLFFQEHNISLSLAQRIYRAYHDKAIEVVKTNPYVLCRDVWGIGFHTADKIALHLGFAPDSPLRLEAAILYTLKRAGEDGHCFLPKAALFSKTESLLQLQSGEAIFESVLSDLLRAGELVAHEEKIYPPYLEWAEGVLAEQIALRLSLRPEARIPEHVVRDYSNRTYDAATVSQQQSGREQLIKLSAEQKRALELVSDHSLLVITGGPGCGKTTVLRALVNLLRASGLEVKLAAPTGRAAQRIAEVCDVSASTIHRLLKFDPATRHFLHNKQNPLALQALIVDESSMIDLPLAASLFEALPKEARVIIVGDADQLPSVGPGRFLADLLTIPGFPAVRLTTLFRRANESSITHIAHQINAGVVPDIPKPDGVIKTDSYFLPISTPEEGSELIERLVCEQIPKRFQFTAQDITVLSPMNKGELGIISLNERLQARLVPADENTPTVRVGSLSFRLGDRVCQRINNYQIAEGGVFNGDQGEVVGIDTVSQVVSVRLWDGRIIEYTPEYLYQLDLAYAITIHRAQGSEVPVVVLVLHDSHSIILERQLLYTGVTRAKRLLIVVGTKRALVLAVKKTRGSRRYTALTERCEQLLQKRVP